MLFDSRYTVQIILYLFYLMCLCTGQNNINFTLILFVMCNVWFALRKYTQQVFETFKSILLFNIKFIIMFY